MKHHRIAAVFLLVSGGLLASTIHEKIDRRVIGIEKIRSQISYRGAQKDLSTPLVSRQPQFLASFFDP